MFTRRINRARAIITGGPLRPQIKGVIYFKNVPGGTEIDVNISGLPPYQAAENNQDPIGPHGFHIHEFGDCKVCDPQNPFLRAGGHWDPNDQPHGNHAGDFPVLFSNNGFAHMRFFTNRFRVADIIKLSVIIHENPNDYRTQPDGAAGRRLACGVIEHY